MYKKITMLCIVYSINMLGSLSGKRELFKEKELLYCNYPSYNGDCTYDIYVETPDEFVIVESGEGHDDSVITTENEFFRSLNQKENKKLFVVNNALSKKYSEFDLFRSSIYFNKISIVDVSSLNPSEALVQALKQDLSLEGVITTNSFESDLKSERETSFQKIEAAMEVCSECGD